LEQKLATMTRKFNPENYILLTTELFAKLIKLKQVLDYTDKNPLILPLSTIDNPSFVHRYSIETMDLRWSNDGVAME